ncbi:Uclacyanin 1 [Bienertia sinuspersici]
MVVKAIIVMIITSSILFQCVSSSVNHTVGGSFGWNLSYSLSLSLVFYLLFLLSINSPISTYFDEFGQTVIPMSQPGWRYFICGRSNYCSLGLKLSIQVLYEISMPINTVSQDTKDQPGNSIRKMADYLLMATVNSVQSLWLKSLWGLCASSIFQ